MDLADEAGGLAGEFFDVLGREGDVDFFGVAGFDAEELILEAGDEGVGAEDQFVVFGFAAFEGLSILISSRKNVRDLLLSLPRFSVLERPFDCGEDEKLRLITSDGYRPAGEGLDRYAGRDRVAIRANDGRGLSVMIEASREEDCFSLYEKAKAELNLRKNAENAPVRK